MFFSCSDSGSAADEETNTHEINRCQKMTLNENSLSACSLYIFIIFVQRTVEDRCCQSLVLLFLT